MRGWRQKFSVYIHWPFCESKCTYCNFNKYVNPSQPPLERLTRALERELTFYLTEPRFGLKHKKVASVYFGGGTPSLATPDTVSRILNTIDRLTHLESGIEVTLEANPTSAADVKHLQAFRSAGVQRLSLGVQSFDDTDLKLLGRDHSAAEAVRALNNARRIFPQVTFDMIFGRCGQDLKGWQRELKMALDLAGDHLSLYQLTLERSTPLWKAVQKNSVPPLPSEDEAADMYEAAVEMTAEQGFAHYEVSNYARTQAAIGNHNFSYWQGLDYVGVGPGAHGRLTVEEDGQRIRTFAEFHPDKYMALCESNGEGIRKWIPLAPREMLEELVVFGMRTRMGVSRQRFRSLTGTELDSILDRRKVEEYIQAGFLLDDTQWPDQDRYVPKSLQIRKDSESLLRPTEAGLALSDSIVPNILQNDY